MSTEQPLAGYEGYYTITPTGKLFTCKRTFIQKNGWTYHMKRRRVTIRYDKDGVSYVWLNKDKKVNKHYLYKLIYATFKGTIRNI